MDIYAKLKELGITLPEAPPPGSAFASIVEFGDKLVYVSGTGPELGGPVQGKVGQEFTVEEGKAHARNCMLNILATLHEELGDLNKIKKPVKLLALVASGPDFYSHPAVANGASELLIQLYGPETGKCTRSAIGAIALPDNIPVEIEAIFELK